MSSAFSAVAPMIGYLYQIRYPLMEMLRTGEGKFLTIEKFDDIGIEDIDGKKTFVQLKHHGGGSLSDASVDLWKTIRIWCSGINNKTIDVSKTNFHIITTQTASNNSIAYYMTPRGKNDNIGEDKIIEKLKYVSGNSVSKENKEAYEEFKKTDLNDLKELINNITIIDNAPSIIDLESKIKKYIKYSCPMQHIDAFYSRLEGWWIKRVIDHLTIESLASISYDELRCKIDDLREQFMLENLPIDFADDINIDTSIYQDKIFLNQLKLIGVKGNRCVNAIHDYYKASCQRSRWSREDLLAIDEIEKYETKLEKEWERIFDSIVEELEYMEICEENKIKCGREIYKTIELDTQINIRKNCSEAYVMRGSYQMLADKLKVGWHPDFKQMIGNIISNQKGA
ncbi:MAG: hypothetical protein E7215_03755 [Clostridium sulfidigenes]|uniref:ABC-three component systems C-terminal domain-containing protein n=1 Tax=Clostridium sulfidigenes TaxID=318464 RepID=A0A927ZKX5_9CLOT|nr:hypothetical protein [Clostridium sulfidigenes]